jgi:RHS repeat-associated protein
MRAKRDKSLINTLARMASPVLAIAIGFYFGAQGPAYSQIESRQTSAPTAAATSSPSINTSTQKYPKPKAPKQVELPAPPPIKYFAGLEEQLVATGPVTEEEGKDLDTALAAFHNAPLKAKPGSDYSDFGKPLQAFVDSHPQSNWNAGLYLSLGLGYYNAGYFSRAFTAFEKSWQLGRSAQSTQARLMVDRAVGELARMHARVGHAKELEAVLKDVGKRPIGGPATELIQGAKEGLWMFRHNPGEAYLCGPKALENVLFALKADKKQLRIVDDARSGPHGVSLTELAKLADKAKFKYTLIKREAGQPIPVPSVVNWNVHHYAAIVRNDNGVYAMQDPTFGASGWIAASAKAIDAETSGYFLVPESVMKANAKAGWRIVGANSAEAKAVYGMGYSTAPGPGNNACWNTQSQPQNSSPTPSQTLLGPQMCVANASSMLVSLKLSDTPVGYAPQKGVPAYTQIVYNSREDLQPATFNISNVSPKWSHSWMRYVQDDPYNPYYNVTRVVGGGGGYVYPYLGYGAGFLTPEIYTNATTQRVTSGGVFQSYVHTLTDGTVETYAQTDGATSYPRKVFLTSIADPQGNTTTLSYDSSHRLTSVTDAMGRSTTFTYGLSSYPLLITQVTDPFGRTTQLTYDTSQRLSTITDPIGITSTVTYSGTEPSFITNLATPYGTSTFSDAINPNDTPEPSYDTRSLTITDPLGYTDYLYNYQNPSITPASTPAAQVPAGFTSSNGYQQWRNTYYWDRHAFAQGCTMSGGVVQSEDFTKAFLWHWTHSLNTGPATSTIDTIEGSKPALEVRTWHSYPGQPYYYQSGTSNTPTQTARVLDSGATQNYQSTVTTNTTAVNQVTSTTDPNGRITNYNYATNNIDLLTVQQLTAPSTYTTIATYGSYTSGHRPQTYTGADGQTWNYAWNTAGQISTVTDPNSGVTTYNYDSLGRLSNIVNANSQTQASYTYDSADRVLTKTDSEGYVLTYAYDNLDRVTSITYPDGTTDLYDYTFQSGPLMGTPSLELRKHTDRLGRVTTYGYDADQRLTSVTEPTQGSSTRTTNYDYYENGTLKDIIDANGNDTHWDIDIESRPTKKTYAYGTASPQAETYTYENNMSRLHSITDALGQVKTFSYDSANEITGVTYTSVINPTPNVTFAWDTYFPRMTSMTDGTGTTNYSYTAIGTNGALKLSSIAGPYSNDTLGLTYDALGQLSGRNIAGGNETFGYDAIGRLTSHGTPLGSFTDTYLGQTNQMASQSVTNGSTTVSTNWGYDTNTNDRRLIGITNSGVTRSYTLSYLNGTSQNPYDIESITDTAAAGHPWATQSHSYTYDLIDRLLTGNQTTPGNFAYGYDNLDNSTTVTTPSGTTSPTFNGFNQISTWGSLNYSYDADGNLISGDGVKTYKWDAENRLIEIDYVGTSNKTVFTYNGNGQRRIVADTISGTTITTRYQWCEDGESICQSRDGSDNVLRRDLDEGEYNVSTGQKLIYAPDQLGSVRDAIDGTTGNLVQSYDFGPFGATVRSNGSTPTDFQFARMFLHPASGLSFATYRVQDGVTGRWLNRDPFRESADTNLYSYVSADPINFVDPAGLNKITICLKQKTVTMTNNNGDVVFSSSAVPGCVSTPSVPPGHYKAGKWEPHKKNPNYWNTRVPYPENPWSGYGPWFLPIDKPNGQYTGTGIHGNPWTGLIPWWSCSHGCIRMSNTNITNLHDALPNSKGTPIDVVGDCAL